MGTTIAVADTSLMRNPEFFASFSLLNDSFTWVLGLREVQRYTATLSSAIQHEIVV